MADVLDVLSLPECYRAVNIPSGDGHDEEMRRFITAVSRRMDEMVGPIVNRTVTEYHDGGCTVIRPRQTPLSSVTSLTEANGTTQTILTAETFGTVPADAYVLDVDAGYGHRCRIHRRSGGSDYHFPSGRRNVKLIYVAGRAATTALVDDRYKMAAGSILRRLWDREAGSWARASDPFEQGVSTRFFEAVWHVVKEQLADEMFPIQVA